MADGGRYVLDAHADIPDARDLIFQPGLATLPPEIDPRTKRGEWWSKSRVRNQGSDPSCTGHALAAMVDSLLVIDRKTGGTTGGTVQPRLSQLRSPYASALMLYGNAQLHDEWHGEGYSGSSLRGAIKGFHHNGVCSIKVARTILENAVADQPSADRKWRWYTNSDVTDDARNVVLGAYMRVRPQLTDMHCAVSESRIVAVTARIHQGWNHPGEDGVIPFDEKAPVSDTGSGYHAFIVIGYTSKGFVIQNSWGRKWGDNGTAIWTYEDWSRNVSDAWTMRLAAPVPGAFRYSVGLQGVAAVVVQANGERAVRSAPTRLDVLGHLLPIVDGRLQRHGPFHHDPQTIAETIRIIERRHSMRKAAATGKRFADEGTAHKLPAEDLKYRHVLIHVMAGGRTDVEAAKYVRVLHPIYRENGIYPVFLLWEPEMFAELRSQVADVIDSVQERAQAAGAQRGRMIARLAEIEATGIPGRLRRELERSVRRFFYMMVPNPEMTPDELPNEINVRNANGIKVMEDMFRILAPRHRAGTLSYHMVGHDLGARFVAEFLSSSMGGGDFQAPVISNLHLVSPMIEQRRFAEQIVPALQGSDEGSVNRKARRREPLVEKATLWCMGDDASRVDRFHRGYPNNWPHFWARVVGTMVKREIDLAAGEAGSAARRYEEISVDEENFPVLRSLALLGFAGMAVRDAQAAGANITLEKLDAEPGDEDAIEHLTLDGSSFVVNEILKSILGEGGVMREFTKLDWQLSR
jgi:hypothetical protein